MSGLYFQGGKHFSTKVVLNKKIKKYIYIYMSVCVRVRVCVCVCMSTKYETRE